MKEVYIVSAVRTPKGSWGGALKDFSATKLGAIAIKGALEKAGISASDFNEVLMGSVLQANLGQTPARQAARFAGVPDNVPCTTVNKICASGMKAVMQGAQAIMLSDAGVVVAGGMETMSNVPFYNENRYCGSTYSNVTLVDDLTQDGLTSVYHNYPIGKPSHSRETETDMYVFRTFEKRMKNLNIDEGINPCFLSDIGFIEKLSLDKNENPQFSFVPPSREWLFEQGVNTPPLRLSFTKKKIPIPTSISPHSLTTRHYHFRAFPVAA